MAMMEASARAWTEEPEDRSAACGGMDRPASRGEADRATSAAKTDRPAPAPERAPNPETPLALALRAIDRPITIVRRLGRERWQQVDPDVLFELGERITQLSARLNADNQRLLALIREFDRLEGWKAEGHASCAAWLAYRTRLDKGTARERVRVARALGERPLTDRAMAEGRLSFSQVRAITRAPAEDEEELLERAKGMSASELERLVRAWGRLGWEDEEAQAARIHRARTLAIFPDDEGAYVIRGKLEPEAGALLMRAIEMASDALYRGSVPATTPERRRADTLALLAERAMAAGFGDEDTLEEERSAGEDRDEADAAPPDAGDVSAGTSSESETVAGIGPAGVLADAASSAPSTRPPSAGVPAPPVSSYGLAHPERYTVVLHVGADTLAGAGEAAGEADREAARTAPHLEDGTCVSAETARRLACDAGILRVVHRKRGHLVEVQGKRRTIPLRLRRALELRDRGCRFPGCGCRFTEVHHVHHWIHGGATRLGNTLLLCRADHRLLHEGAFRVAMDPSEPGRPIFHDPRGHRIPDVPPEMSVDGRPVGNGSPTRHTGAHRLPRWEWDVPLDFYLRAMDALDR